MTLFRCLTSHYFIKHAIRHKKENSLLHYFFDLFKLLDGFDAWFDALSLIFVLVEQRHIFASTVLINL